MVDPDAGRRHYERRVAQSRASSKTIVRNSTDESTMNELSKGIAMFEDDTVIDIFVQRDGSSQRTVEELINVFLDDVTALASEDEHLDCCGSVARLDELRDRAGDSEALSWLADQAENLLADLGYLVEWDDGYIIYREA